MKLTPEVVYMFVGGVVLKKFITDNLPCLKVRSLFKYAKSGLMHLRFFFLCLFFYIVAKLAAAGIIKLKPQTVFVLIAALVTVSLLKMFGEIQKKNAVQF